MPKNRMMISKGILAKSNKGQAEIMNCRITEITIYSCHLNKIITKSVINPIISGLFGTSSLSEQLGNPDGLFNFRGSESD